MVECIVGSASPNGMCLAIASSLSSLTKSARQYHCKPGGYSASNMLCNAGCGSGPTKSSAGFLKARIGLNVSSAFSGGPAYAQTTPHIFFMCKCYGNGGAGGTVRKAKKPFRSSGAEGIRSRYHFITSAVSLNSYSIGPAYGVSIGCNLNVN